jgi:tetratricopeptide (TPR) repeat protein
MLVAVGLVFLATQAGAAEEKVTAPKETKKTVAAPLSKWEEGNQFYKAKDYRQAIQAYQAVLARHPHDPAVYFNLANAYFKRGEAGMAIYQYEKALALDPRSKDIRQNLNFARSQLRSESDAVKPVFLNWTFKVLSFFSKGELITAALAAYLLFLGAAILRFYSASPFVFWVRRLTFSVFLISFTGLGFKLYEARRPAAIVIHGQVEARYGPSPEEKAVFRLSEGMKVRVAEQSQGWYRIKLSSGDTGWVVGSSLGVLQ